MVQVAVLPIGLLFDSSQAFTRGVMRGIEQYAQSRPSWVLLFHDAHGFTRRSLLATPPAGLIAHVANPRLARILQFGRLPVVNTSFMLPEAPFPRVGVDNREVGRLAFAHLRDRGFSHFGVVGHRAHQYSAEREAGFCESLDDGRHSYATFYQRRNQHSSSEALALDAGDQLQRWLRALPKPVGIFTCRGVWGVQVIEACRRCGLGVPDDVGVVCVDNDDLLCEMSRPSLSSIVVPSERIGFAAAALLERLLENHPPRMPSVSSTRRSFNSTRMATRSKQTNTKSRAVRAALGTHEVRLVPSNNVITRQSSDVYAVADADLTLAMEYIRRHAHELIHVDDVCREVSMPRRVLEQMFCNRLQRGIGEEIRRVRLERTKHLLSTTALPIAKVAEQAGFSSLYYMSRVFRQQTGLTPTAFRSRFHRFAPG